jgi:hypothetical protein
MSLGRTTRFVVLCLGGVAFACAPSGGTGTPQGAKGDTPIRYIICGVMHEDCRVYARFDDLSSCKDHEKFSSALCESKGPPGTIVCDTTVESVIQSYCLP